MKEAATAHRAAERRSRRRVPAGSCGSHPRPHCVAGRGLRQGRTAKRGGSAGVESRLERPPPHCVAGWGQRVPQGRTA